MSNRGKGIILMVLSSLCVCVGQLFWKLSSNSGLLYLLLGFCVYGIGYVFMVVAYKYGKLSSLQPILSLNYALAIIIAAVFLNERITVLKGLGVLTIIIGVILIAGGKSE